MRIGNNLSKEKNIKIADSYHRAIIPIYIPHENEYYKNAFKIFEYCLFSLLKASASALKVSVVSNGCTESVNQRLLMLQQRGLIDELIIETEAIGKINSILKALRTAEERLITITDADVLFCNGWETAVLDVFKAFPNAGAVSPVPVFRKQLHLTANIWMKYFFSKKLYFRPVKNPEAMERFAQSIGWNSLEERFKDLICTLKSNENIAVLGCSHFVATYKREVFQNIPKGGSNYKLGGDSEFKFTDEPVLKMGGYRLSTYDNYAYHLGNHFEPWMEEMFQSIQYQEKTDEDFSGLKTLQEEKIGYFISEKVFRKLFYNRKLYNYILRRKGLSKGKIKTFWY